MSSPHRFELLLNGWLRSTEPNASRHVIVLFRLIFNYFVELPRFVFRPYPSNSIWVIDFTDKGHVTQLIRDAHLYGKQVSVIRDAPSKLSCIERRPQLPHHRHDGLFCFVKDESNDTEARIMLVSPVIGEQQIQKANWTVPIQEIGNIVIREDFPDSALLDLDNLASSDLKSYRLASFPRLDERPLMFIDLLRIGGNSIYVETPKMSFENAAIFVKEYPQFFHNNVKYIQQFLCQLWKMVFNTDTVDLRGNRLCHGNHRCYSGCSTLACSSIQS